MLNWANGISSELSKQTPEWSTDGKGLNRDARVIDKALWERGSLGLDENLCDALRGCPAGRCRHSAMPSAISCSEVKPHLLFPLSSRQPRVLGRVAS